ncbi:unnamed protein product [Paramecium pentaurelia]|uniref:non-specific serine/threonine protein kinase n=1 Tax=Paramecium pentaurelia TaxID=43138 RepID=A0A8S1UNE1_9CILI|nr:unnamed protein product [Paramecium pentaurelia]
MEDDSRIINDDESLISNDCQVNETYIKQYKKVKLIGVGAYGKAYLVTSDDQDETKYVMKVVPQSISANTEAQILQNLKHDNIIQYFETFIDNKDRLCLIMEYANNGTLGQYLKQRTQPLPEAQIVDWFTQLCLALQCVHSQKIIHRDIKSENVFLHDDKIKLGDFGIARSVEQDLATTFIGTPYYISPEIIQNQPYSYKSDIWSLGVLLYEMCTFKYPFTADSLPALAIKIVKAKIQPISAQQYSQNMKNLIQQILQLDANKRPTLEQILQNGLIQNRIKSLNIKQQQIIKIPVQPIQKKQQHQVVIKKDEYIQNKKLSREEQQKFMREDIQKKKCQQKPQEVVIELFGQPKIKQEQQQQQQITQNDKKQSKRRDIPVEIYLPSMSRSEFLEQQQLQQQQQQQQQEQQEQQQQEQQLYQPKKEIDNNINQLLLERQISENLTNQEVNNSNKEKQIPKKQEILKNLSQETQAAQKPIIKLSFERAEKIRMNLEQVFGADQFLRVYQVFKNLREKNTQDQIYQQYGPSYQNLILDINQQCMQEQQSNLFMLLDFDLEQ